MGGPSRRWVRRVANVRARWRYGGQLRCGDGGRARMRRSRAHGTDAPPAAGDGTVALPVWDDGGVGGGAAGRAAAGQAALGVISACCLLSPWSAGPEAGGLRYCYQAVPPKLSTPTPAAPRPFPPPPPTPNPPPNPPPPHPVSAPERSWGAQDGPAKIGDFGSGTTNKQATKQQSNNSNRNFFSSPERTVGRPAPPHPTPPLSATADPTVQVRPAVRPCVPAHLLPPRVRSGPVRSGPVRSSARTTTAIDFL